MLEGGIVGITPACAGKSPKRRYSLLGGQDHPRLRGEKLWGKGLWRELSGSPPLARGKAGTK